MERLKGLISGGVRGWCAWVVLMWICFILCVVLQLNNFNRKPNMFLIKTG